MNHTQFKRIDLIAALCVVVVWGTNFVAMKLALKDFTPFQLGAARYVLAVLPLILVVRPPRMPWKWVVLYGLVQGVGQFGLLFLALRIGMTAALASVLLQTQVFFTALFGFVLLREPVGRSLQVGLVLAALGLGCFVMNYVAPGRVSSSASSPLGFGLCLGAAAMWAVSNIVVRRARQSSPAFDVTGFLVWSSAVPILPFVGLSLAFDAPASRWHWTQAPISSWLSIAYLGWIATILAYTMWTGLLTRHAVNRVAPFSLGVPIVGLAAGMIALNEVVTPWQWAGIALLLGALIRVFLKPGALLELLARIGKKSGTAMR